MMIIKERDRLIEKVDKQSRIYQKEKKAFKEQISEAIE